MLKKLLFVLCLIVLASCGAKKKTTDKVTTTTSKVTLGTENITYKSLGNGVASIAVQFYDNDTFQFQFESIPQPESDDKPIRISEKGYYTAKGAWKTITFQNPSFSVASLFDSSYSTGDDFKVVDKQSVAINTAKETISIWGVLCEKQ
jgi:hypothetical protein